MDRDINLLIIGALISLVTTLCVQLIQLYISNYQKNKGKINIYFKSVYSSITSKPWGIDKSSNGIILLIPLWIEIQNTKGKNEIVRDLNLFLYKDNKRIKNMVQVTHTSNSEKTDYFGDEGVYSFLLEPESIRRYKLNFTIKMSDVNEEFDRIKIGYFDTKDKYRESILFETPDGWKTINTKIDSEWRKMVQSR
ncbi:hypothetical protein I6N95_25765 [Vagococcus sp. BWB3-3]|uniref:Uncharacterized protein n=1 Tax=Vagococcus allomyrinae TaxID=2794353 RepID=A0A940PB86_9ENTE|nr:hypothetical protein [Vagococcus allomyrinae]MBP1044420.1 hypothetical protein [Vagococcus allomyrinae]